MRRRIDWDTRGELRGPRDDEQTLLIDARGFSPEGADCDARLAVAAYELGWRHLVHYHSRGTRFHAAGFGPETDGLRIDCYDNVGQTFLYGAKGGTFFVRGNAAGRPMINAVGRPKVVINGTAASSRSA